MVLKKIKRLIIPSILFSALYITLYGGGYKSLSVIDVLTGAGHMWFLPMLFFCFIETYFLQLVNISERLKVLLVFILGLVGWLPIPFQIGQSLYYLQYFYIGYLLWEKNSLLRKIHSNQRDCCLLWLNFIFVFVVTRFILDNFTFNYDEAGYFGKAAYLSLKLGLNMLCAWTGVFSFYYSSLLFTKLIYLPDWIIRMGEYCMGIYLFQQFILQSLYFHSTLPEILGQALPWIGFIIALIGSLCLSSLIKMSSLGRKLI